MTTVVPPGPGAGNAPRVDIIYGTGPPGPPPSYSSGTTLPATGNPGELFTITGTGTSADGDQYAWNGQTQSWDLIANNRGPAGPVGPVSSAAAAWNAPSAVPAAAAVMVAGGDYMVVARAAVEAGTSSSPQTVTLTFSDPAGTVAGQRRITGPGRSYGTENTSVTGTSQAARMVADGSDALTVTRNTSTEVIWELAVTGLPQASITVDGSQAPDAASLLIQVTPLTQGPI